MSQPGGPGAQHKFGTTTLADIKLKDMEEGESGAYEILKDDDLACLTELEKTRLDFRFWKQKADEYSFGKGDIVVAKRTVFPRFEHYKKCHDVVKDWLRCKTINRFLTASQICTPLKDQVAMCVNDTWVERYKYRHDMYENVWSKQAALTHTVSSQATYDKAFLSLMIDDHDSD